MGDAAIGAILDRAAEVLEALPTPVTILSAVRDDGGQIVDFLVRYVNPVASATVDIPRSEQVGRRVAELSPYFVESGLFADYARVVETGEPLVKESVEYEDEWGDHEISGVYEIHLVKFGDGVLVSFRDLTEQRRAERRARLAVSELERRRLAQEQVSEINDHILASLVEISRALDIGDARGARGALTKTFDAASRIITELGGTPRQRLRT